MPSHLDPALSNRAISLAQSGDIAGAFQLLEQASKAGDAYAAATLANWRMSGALIRRDLAAARDLYGTAAKLGLADAEPVFQALLATGAGGIERHWTEALDRLKAQSRRHPHAKRQVELLRAMDLDLEGDPKSLAPPEPVCMAPAIEIRRGFLSPGECTYLIDIAKPQLQPAVIVHPQTGQQIRDPIRVSDIAIFPFVAEDPVIHALNRRIAVASSTAYEQGEPLQVLSYGIGNEYKLHSDTLPPGQNQRVGTVLVWLNDGFEGGETEFPRLSLKLRGSPGDAVYFRNVQPDGSPDTAAWHAGLPVLRGRKFLLSKWLRMAPLDLSGPPGRPF